MNENTGGGESSGTLFGYLFERTQWGWSTFGLSSGHFWVIKNIREQLKQQQKRVKSRALDLINAAIALEHDLTLVTRNVEDYQDIPGLELYPLTA